jgi:RND family efflux transporter MFP subunit
MQRIGIERFGGWARIGLWSLLVTMVALIVLFKLRPKAVETVAPPPERAVAVRVVTVVPHDVTDTIVLPGRVLAFVDVPVPARKGAAVTEILTERGAGVQAGQVLLKLDDRVWQTLLEQAQIELRDARREQTRWQEMRKTGAVSQSDYDAVARRLALASNAVDQAQAHVEQCLVKAPINGRVEERWVEPGEFVNEGQATFRVVDASRVKVRIDIPERDVAAIRDGDRVRFDVAALGGAAYTGVVAFVASAAQPDVAAFVVELLVDPAPAGLKPGMIAAVHIGRGFLRSAVTVPLAAVVPQRGENIVFVVEEGRAVRRVVRLDRFLKSEAVVAAGLTGGEALVVEGQRSLQDGLAVTVADNLIEGAKDR